jgi:hypothetical protein
MVMSQLGSAINGAYLILQTNEMSLDVYEKMGYHFYYNFYLIYMLFIFFTMVNTSSSLSIWSNPTFWPLNFALLPQICANRKSFIILRWTLLQTSATVLPFLIIILIKFYNRIQICSLYSELKSPERRAHW